MDFIVPLEIEAINLVVIELLVVENVRCLQFGFKGSARDGTNFMVSYIVLNDLQLLRLRDEAALCGSIGVTLENLVAFVGCGCMSCYYEWDVGHFQGAQRPDVDCFRSTSFGLSSTEDVSSDLLSNVDKEKTDIMMYCTGGIRCDVYSTILRKQGFRNLYTLEGGISNYLKTEGPIKWVGNLFTFDSRLSLPPSAFHQTRSEASTTQQDFQNDKFAKCYVCGSDVSELRHRNCANLDCNLLFL
ncbi:hypothetical protein COLO4_06405 [Corchorus olitorius]|uniref:Rhodanese domain-containing protein n=1 Tax=Corchorus olitorius TaxID=93759 RepID=A0A1R3KN60_9ROSI|nr:hypothetical protein COLO4_06405 [Corchorus olitorius]